jgi:hypothetical protein
MTMQLFIERCSKHRDGLIKERYSNTGKSMCLYSADNTPICYIDLERFNKMKSLFKETKGGYKLNFELK